MSYCPICGDLLFDCDSFICGKCRIAYAQESADIRAGKSPMPPGLNEFNEANFIKIRKYERKCAEEKFEYLQEHGRQTLTSEEEAEFMQKWQKGLRELIEKINQHDERRKQIDIMLNTRQTARSDLQSRRLY